MNRINQLFATKKRGILSIYFCAGYPTLDGTREIIKNLEQNGIDMIEIGIPFSDPMADGPVIQHAATQALHNGMTLKVLFSQLSGIRNDVKIPLVLMGYLNPIMQYGFENFCHSCRDCGIDGIIIPDLPFKEYIENYKEIAERHRFNDWMMLKLVETYVANQLSTASADTRIAMRQYLLCHTGYDVRVAQNDGCLTLLVPYSTTIYSSSYIDA